MDEAETRMLRWFTIICGLFMALTGGFTAGFATMRGDLFVAWFSGAAALLGMWFCGVALFNGRHPFDDPARKDPP